MLTDQNFRILIYGTNLAGFFFKFISILHCSLLLVSEVINVVVYYLCSLIIVYYLYSLINSCVIYFQVILTLQALLSPH